MIGTSACVNPTSHPMEVICSQEFIDMMLLICIWVVTSIETGRSDYLSYQRIISVCRHYIPLLLVYINAVTIIFMHYSSIQSNCVHQLPPTLSLYSCEYEYV